MEKNIRQALKTGTLLDHGKYRIERVLGQGGFGITYLVFDTGLEQYRAIKEFFPKDFCRRDEITGNLIVLTESKEIQVEQLKRKFLKEALNISRLGRHPGIIRIFTTFEENDTAYYVMEYIAGENLSEIVKRGGPLPLARALKYVIEIGKTLEYVHRHRINHLDVKPANIMVRNQNDKLILIDFGLSKRYDSDGKQTTSNPLGISHGFAPIEQYNAGGLQVFSPQTDVYSLAATLYFLLTGVVPPNAPTLINSVLTFPTNVPSYLQAEITRAMHPKRNVRPENVMEFVRRLEKKGKNPSPRPPGVDDGNQGTKNLGQIVLIILAIIVFIFIAVFIGAQFYNRSVKSGNSNESSSTGFTAGERIMQNEPMNEPLIADDSSSMPKKEQAAPVKEERVGQAAQDKFVAEGNFYGSIGGHAIHGCLILETDAPEGWYVYDDTGERIEVGGSSDGREWTEYYNDQPIADWNFSRWDYSYKNFAKGNYKRYSDGKVFPITLYMKNI